MSHLDGNEKLETLSQILIDCFDEGDFWTFAVENEEAVRVALYAKSVIDGYAVATEKLISECEDAIEILREFLDDADSEEV